MTAPGLLVLRLALAMLLVPHGAHVLFGTFAGPGIGPGGLAASTTYLSSLGLSPAYTFALIIGLGRFVGGWLVAAGCFTRVATSCLLAIELLLASRDGARWGFFMNWVMDPTRGHGLELTTLVAGALLCLALTGAGDWSIDGLRQRSARALAAGRARLRERA